MNKFIAKPYLIFYVAMLSLTVTRIAAAPQQVPLTFIVIRNDANTSMTIEFRANDRWQQAQLRAGADTNLKCDRVRVATMRSDNAVITVDLPVQMGKKYRLVWNDAAAIWDFNSAL
jgi:hypothetical protein